MARFMTGTGSFEYHYITGSRSIDLSLLAKASGVGLLVFAVEYLVTFPEGAPQAFPWGEAVAQAGLPAVPDGGFYEVPAGEEPQPSFDLVCLTEQARVPALRVALRSAEGAAPTRIDLRGKAQFRLTAADWDGMLEWLNSFLTAELKITRDTLRAFDRGALERFNPDEDGEGDKATGTRYARFLYAANADRYLPYLALRIITHAVQQDLGAMTVEETDRLWRGTLWAAPTSP
jgi:hypothetical protein